ncbi:serine hydrolase [Paenibacillus sp. P96]|uniref:Serine hydrolase n=1 Tax=Paenibacillus zeirhizosphaerae TaxID=2987519 RepID=A0ABT9FTS1_9BACL|nr:serine hydrolase [Paenibacillus sp. P96]MDP4098015.1 serine hydrolase [Paenibacillus sp. P96]
MKGSTRMEGHGNGLSGQEKSLLYERGLSFMRYFVLLLLCVALFAGSSSHTVLAQSGAITVTVDGAEQHWNTKPYIAYGTTYVPLREAAGALGAIVRWNAGTSSAIVQLNGDVITYKLGSTTVDVNGYAWQQSSPLRYVKGVLTVPLRGVIEPLRATVKPAKTAEGTLLEIQSDGETVLNSTMKSVDAYLRGESFSGLALVAKDGQVLLRKGYGPAGDGKFNRPDMTTRIASLSKSFTAAAVLKLSEAGSLDLQDPVSQYIPDFPRGDEITLHMLLSHTGGLRANFTRTEGMTLQDAVHEIKQLTIQWEPGTRFQYSNCGYVVLAYIIEQASGMSYGDYLEKNVLGPLGLKHTGQATPATPTIKGHTYNNDVMTEAPYYVSVEGTGTLYSTLDDILIWNSENGLDKLLRSESLTQMLTPYSEKNYGYGVLIRQDESGQGMTIYHNGSGTGYKTGMMRDTGTGLTVILLGNRDGLDTVPMMDEIMTRAHASGL